MGQLRGWTVGRVGPPHEHLPRLLSVRLAIRPPCKSPKPSLRATSPARPITFHVQILPSPVDMWTKFWALGSLQRLREPWSRFTRGHCMYSRTATPRPSTIKKKQRSCFLSIGSELSLISRVPFSSSNKRCFAFSPSSLLSSVTRFLNENPCKASYVQRNTLAH